MESIKSGIDAMKISVHVENDSVMSFMLIRQDCEKEIEWKYKDEQYNIEISMDHQLRQVINVSKSDNITEEKDSIKHIFLEALFEYKMNLLISSEDGFDEADDGESDDGERMNPYNPKLIRVDPKTFSIGQIYQMIEYGEIDLSPDFQRNFVWTDITRKSRLIESLLLRIPIPVFYFSQDEEGLFQVVDGVQRLTVIHAFMQNKFKLRNLEYLTECNDKWYKKPGRLEESLDNMYTRRIEQTQLYINIIDPQTPGRVKYDIFKRINTGGKALNNQEIRNCLAHRRTRGLLHDLAKSEEFKRATRGSISSTRMADEELILRFIAFYLLDRGKTVTKEYKSGMDALLDETVELLNTMSAEMLQEIRISFLSTMDMAYYLFQERTFRKANFINKALFLGITRVLCTYSMEEIQKKDRTSIAERMNEQISKNISFSGALSMATNDARNVKIVYDTVKKVIEDQNA